MMPAAPPLLVVDSVSREFRSRRGSVRALDRVSLSIPEGSTLALVGESGSGKTTAARVVLGLERPDSGRVLLSGQEVTRLNERNLRRLRRTMQVVLQDPYGQLNRRHTVERIVAAPLLAFRIGTRQTRADRVRELLHAVGLQEHHLRRRPHELSGGQCQRVAIARALAVQPRLLVLDECVSALDVSIRAQILNLLRRLQSENGLTYLFITHDLGVAQYMAQSIAVMYRGRVVESGHRKAVFAAAQHPYTESLLASIPSVDAAYQKSAMERAAVNPLPDVVPGDACLYLSRCPVTMDRDRCAAERPPLAAGPGGHLVACHFPAQMRVSAATPPGGTP
jgi:oligopeptide/dipeptide ABC transporter ATP-binding protein